MLVVIRSTLCHCLHWLLLSKFQIQSLFFAVELMVHLLIFFILVFVNEIYTDLCVFRAQFVEYFIWKLLC